MRFGGGYPWHGIFRFYSFFVLTVQSTTPDLQEMSVITNALNTFTFTERKYFIQLHVNQYLPDSKNFVISLMNLKVQHC
jgi:hypothetical protein